ncbi:MAG: prolyl oligopeptidase family serine peptidase [Armatimonadota bacterium]
MSTSRSKSFGYAAGISAGMLAATAAVAATTLRYPETRVSGERETKFGVTVEDPYRWLEDASAPEVKEWMDAQDQVARDYLQSLPGRSRLAKRFRELFYIDSISAPAVRGGRFFYSRRHADREKAVVYWKEGEEGAEQVLLDPNTMSDDGSVSLGSYAITKDGKRVAYVLRRNNADEGTLYVMEVASRQVSEIDVLPGIKFGGAQWTPDGKGFYYTYHPTDESIPVAERTGHSDIRYHRLGTDPKRDVVVREKTGDPTKFQGVGVSHDGRWLFLSISQGWDRSDVYYQDRRAGDTAWKPLVVGKRAQYGVFAWKDRFYIQTDEGAPRGRVFTVDAKKPARENWRELVPERADAVLQSADIVGGRLSLSYLKNASSSLEVRTLDGKLERQVALPEIGSVGSLLGQPDQETAYYSFTSFLRPTEIHQISLKDGKSKLWAKVDVPIDPSPYLVEQVWYPSKDGTKISMFVVRRKDLPRDGSTPFLLTGYGGFNSNQTPYFSSALYPWLEAGGGFALPNLRGGGEYGEEWHQAGMLDKKQNVFDDFIGAAEFLAKEGYTKPERLAIRGGSNGGLLVGAAMTQRPDLFGAVICAVPLLDMVRYHLFGLGKAWIPEYGTADREADFRWLHAYSPYHRVQKGAKYPALLMLSADSDDRVDPLHARKFTAAIQASGTPNPTVMRIEKNAGHGGADLVKSAVEQSADTYAFLLQTLQVEQR